MLAEGIELDPKQVSIAGSGRLGYSLAPKKWGEPYRPHASDLDFFAVSERLFEGLCQDFERWGSDYDLGLVAQKTAEKSSIGMQIAWRLHEISRGGFSIQSGCPTTINIAYFRQ